MTAALSNEQRDLLGEFLFFHVGDINKDADVRHTLRELTKICRCFNHDNCYRSSCITAAQEDKTSLKQ